MRLRPTVLALAAAVLLVGGASPAAAAPGGDRPPRTQGGVSDPRGDATGGTENRQQRADLVRVRYRMPLPRNGRTLTVSADVRLLRFGGFQGDRDPLPQQLRVLLDGPGARDYRLTVFNTSRSPRLVLLGTRTRDPRVVGVRSASWGGGDGSGPDTFEVSLSTEWLTADRMSFTTTGRSGRAGDPSDTARRLNTAYAGRSRSGGTASLRGGSRCRTTDDGFRCASGR